MCGSLCVRLRAIIAVRFSKSQKSRKECQVRAARGARPPQPRAHDGRSHGIVTRRASEEGFRSFLSCTLLGNFETVKYLRLGYCCLLQSIWYRHWRLDLTPPTPSGHVAKPGLGHRGSASSQWAGQPRSYDSLPCNVQRCSHFKISSFLVRHEKGNNCTPTATSIGNDVCNDDAE